MVAGVEVGTTGTRSEGLAAGRLIRKRIPRASFGQWSPDPARPDPIQVLQRQGEQRVQELLPLRYGRMSESAFAFFRGAAAIMAADIGPRDNTGIVAQLCGDAHVSNFGIFASPTRSLVFDCNDFDETLPGPWEWDVMRFVASLAVAGRQYDFSESRRAKIISNAVRTYRETVTEFANESSLKVWYAHLNADEALADWAAKGKQASKQASRVSKKARRKDSLRAFSRMADFAGDRPRFRSEPPILVPVSELMQGWSESDIYDGLTRTLKKYRRTLSDDKRHLLDSYQVVDAARRVVGVGSVGTNAWIALLMGPTEDDPLILQFKEATNSVLEPYWRKTKYTTQGRRVVEGQRLMQANSDILLGWERMDGPWGGERDFYVRQLWDGKYSADLDVMDTAELAKYASLCAWTLARAHCRSGDRFQLAGYLGSGSTFDSAMVDFAERYAEQNDQDYRALLAAIDAGDIEVERGI